MRWQDPSRMHLYSMYRKITKSAHGRIRILAKHPGQDAKRALTSSVSPTLSPICVPVVEVEEDRRQMRSDSGGIADWW